MFALRSYIGQTKQIIKTCSLLAVNYDTCNAYENVQYLETDLFLPKCLFDLYTKLHHANKKISSSIFPSLPIIKLVFHLLVLHWSPTSLW